MSSRLSIVGLVRWSGLAVLLLGAAGAHPPSPRTFAPGPEGGRVTALVAHAESPRRLFLAAAGGGVFRSLDDGASWQAVTEGLASLDVITLAIDPGAPAVVYAGTLGDGLFRTLDGGEHWHSFSPGFGGARIKTVVVTPRGTVWLGTAEHGILRRDPGDEGFREVGNPAGAPVFSLLVMSPTHLWAGTAGGLYESFDGGRAWIDRSDGLPSRFVKTVTSDPHHAGRLWAATGAGLALREASGQAWRPAAGGFPAVETRAVAFFGEDRIQAATAAGIFTSDDGGRTWSPTALPGHPDVATILARENGDGLAGTAVGISRTVDGGRSWQERNHGLVATSILALAEDGEQRSTLYAGSGGGRVHVSRDGGRSWRPTPRSPGFAPVTAMLNLPPTAEEPGRLLAAAGSELRSSSDDGGTWHPWGAGLPAGRISALVRDPARSGRVFAALLGAGVFVSPDRGRTFEAHGEGLEDRVVRDLAAGADGTLFAATPTGLFVWPAGAAAWQRRGLDLPREPAALDVDAAAEAVAVVTRPSGVFLSHDQGWSFHSRGRVPGLVHDVALVSDGSGGLHTYVASADGVFEPVGEDAWAPVAGASREALCLQAASDLGPAGLRVGTHGRGVVAGRGLRNPWAGLNP